MKKTSCLSTEHNLEICLLPCYKNYVNKTLKVLNNINKLSLFAIVY